MRAERHSDHLFLHVTATIEANFQNDEQQHFIDAFVAARRWFGTFIRSIATTFN
jgi:hypothetical protein